MKTHILEELKKIFRKSSFSFPISCFGLPHFKLFSDSIAENFSGTEDSDRNSPNYPGAAVAFPKIAAGQAFFRVKYDINILPKSKGINFPVLHRMEVTFQKNKPLGFHLGLSERIYLTSDFLGILDKFKENRHNLPRFVIDPTLSR